MLVPAYTWTTKRAGVGSRQRYAACRRWVLLGTGGWPRTGRGTRFIVAMPTDATGRLVVSVLWMDALLSCLITDRVYDGARLAVTAGHREQYRGTGPRLALTRAARGHAL